jgi:hypothetical protein
MVMAWKERVTAVQSIVRKTDRKRERWVQSMSSSAGLNDAGRTWRRQISSTDTKGSQGKAARASQTVEETTHRFFQLPRELLSEALMLRNPEPRRSAFYRRFDVECWKVGPLA